MVLSTAQGGLLVGGLERVESMARRRRYEHGREKQQILIDAAGL
jgi:hypothetical protein